MYGDRDGFSYDEVDKVHPAIDNIGEVVNIGLFNHGTKVAFKVFPGGPKGSARYKKGWRIAVDENNKERDFNNRSFEVRDTKLHPNV